MQVNKENKSMRDFKKDSTSAVSRFGRDKRQRVSSTQRVERSPRPQRDADSVSVELRTTLTLRLITVLWASSSQEVTQGAVHVAATAQRADRERAIAQRVVSEVATVERMVRRVDLAVSQSSEQVTLHAKVLREVSRRAIVAMRTVRIQSMLPSSHRRCV